MTPTKALTYIAALLCTTLMAACRHAVTAPSAATGELSPRASLRVWSDLPAFTSLFANQDAGGVTTDAMDGVWEGDSVPTLPRVAHPAAEVKRWHAGEWIDYLDEETAAATGGRYTNPERIWEAEPYPIGNGRIGVSVFNGSGRDRYALCESSFWSGGRNGGTINAKGDKSYRNEEGPDADDDCFGGQQPVGDLIVDFGAAAARGSFVRELLLDRALVRSQASRGGVVTRSTAFCSHPDQIVVLHYAADRPRGLNLQLSYATQRPTDSVAVQNDRLTLTSTLANGMSLRAEARIEVFGGVATAAPRCITVASADSMVVRLAVETNYVMDYRRGWRGSAPDQRTAQRLEAAVPMSYAQLLSRHVGDYRCLFDRMSLRLPDVADSIKARPTYARLADYAPACTDTGLEETLFNFGRYLMTATSRGDGLPGGLQGIWNGMEHAPWGNDYHSNINLQMVYWLPEVGNLSECHESLLDYLYATREPNRLATREYHAARGDTALSRIEGGDEGWIVYTSHNPFGGHGWQVNLPGSAWYALHMWEHFSFGRDTLYLREKSYPMMRELSRYWASHLKTLGAGAAGFVSEYQPVDVSQYPELAGVPDGTLVVPCGWSPEHGPRGEDGVAHDQQIVRELFENTIRAAAVLQVDSAWCDTLRTLCHRMLPPQIGKRGNLMEWMIDRDPVTVHRHTSHLFGLFPGSTISRSQTPELADAARQSLLFRKNEGESRTSWAWTWRSMLWSRLGDGPRAHAMMEGLISHNMLDNLLTSHKLPQQIDGSYGIAAAMIEMLLQSDPDGTLHLLPALPPTWQQGGELRGAKARGGKTVDITWRNGRVVEHKVH